MSGLKSRERKIEKLENEISKDDEGELMAGERLKELQRCNAMLTQQLREKEALVRGLESEKGTTLQQVAALQRELKRLHGEKKELQDIFASKDQELEQALDQVKLRDDKIVKVKDELQKEMTQRIMELKQEKLALEERLEEMEDEVDPNHVLTENSFQDELAQLDDFKPLGQTPKSEARHFTFDETRAPRPLASPRFIGLISPRNFMISPKNFVDSKQTDKLKLELSEKDFLIKALKSDNEALEEKIKELQDSNFDLCDKLEKFEVERTSTEIYYKAMLKDQTIMLTLKNDRLETCNMEMRSELEKTQIKLMKSSETWAEENNVLRASVTEAEMNAYISKHKYIEAATDRDIFMKRYTELAREKSLMGRIGSIFKRKK